MRRARLRADLTIRSVLRLPLYAALLLATVSLPGCGGGTSDGSPAATAFVSFNKDRVPIGSAVTLTYKFEVAPDAKLPPNDWVFVHVMDADGQMMWTDDHVPPTPTGQWQPGQTVQYQRTIFVPNYPYIGEATVRLGLYDRDSGERVVLNNEEVVRREYLVGKVRILPQSENIFLVYKDGWYPPEVQSTNPAVQWRWSAKTGTVQFQNPKKDLTLYVEYAGRPDLFTPPQQVSVKIGDQIVGQFAADAKDPALKTVPISAAQLGAGQFATLALDVDRTFTPGPSDTRTLGIQVYHLYLEPR